MTHLRPKRNMVPKAVLMSSGLVSLTTTRPVNTAQPKTKVNISGKNINVVRPKAKVNTTKLKAIVNIAKPKAVLNAIKGNQGNLQMDLHDQGVIDSGCSRHMTRNMSYLTDFKEIDGGYAAFRVPRKNNMYSVDLKNIVPKGGLTCLFAKATSDESKLWHRRLGHINFKTMNKLVKGNLVRGLPSKLFENDQTCVACQKGKQHRASNQSNRNTGTKACDDAGKARMETVPGKDYILLPLWPADLPFSQNSKSSPDAGFKPSGDNKKKVTEEPRKEGGDSSNDQEKEDDNVNNTNNVNTASDGNITNNVNDVSLTVNVVGIEVNAVGTKTSIELLDDLNMPKLEDIVYSDDDEDVGA
ncbi:ribonuclease H-like domain-containing protein [Tanacetum coccineum]